VSPKKKKGQKQKSIVRAPRDDVVVEGNGKGKKAKANQLKIHKVVNMIEVEVNKLKPLEIKVINKLYKKVFTSLYKWGKKPFAHDNNEPLCVHYRYLHKVLPRKFVYRKIASHRLKGITNQIFLDVDYQSVNQYITVLPIKLDLLGLEQKVAY